MLTELINKNQKMPDPRAGSTPALAGTLIVRLIHRNSLTTYAAYNTACNGSVGVLYPATAIALAPPPSWDGPFDAQLGLPATIFTVIVGALLGGSAIFLLSNM